MNVLDFIALFPGENDCLSHLKTIREKIGMTCTRCKSTQHRWLAGKNQFECTKCGQTILINSGTIMEDSKLSIKDWFIAIYLFTLKNRPTSASEMQKQMGYPEYEPVSDLFRKLSLLKINNSDKNRFEELLTVCATNQIDLHLLENK